MYRKLQQNIESRIEKFLGQFSKESEYVQKKHVCLALKSLVKKYTVSTLCDGKPRYYRLRPNGKNWAETAEFLFKSKESRAHVKDGVPNFKIWASQKMGVSATSATVSSYIRAFKTFRDTEVINLPFNRVKAFFKFQDHVVEKLKAGRFRGHSIRELELMPIKQFTVLISKTKKKKRKPRPSVK